MAKQLLRLPTVISLTGMSRSSIYAEMANGAFPTSIKLTERSVAWDADVIDAWITAKIKAGHNSQKPTKPA